MDAELIDRAEIASLLFAIHDIVHSLGRIEQSLGGDDGEEETDEG
jgi:hypothetical protein